MKVTPKQLAQTLYDLTDGKSKPEIEKSIASFARYICKERKLKIADQVIEQFARIYDRENEIVEAEITTAEKLSAPVEKKVRNYIEKKYRAKKVILKNIIDENIKGGVIVKVGDEVMDGSVKGKLNELKKLLTN